MGRRTRSGVVKLAERVRARREGKAEEGEGREERVRTEAPREARRAERERGFSWQRMVGSI